MPGTVLYEREGHIATITYNRPEALNADQARDLLEIVEDRYDKGSIVITSQIPVDRWHDLIVWNPSPEASLARKGNQIEITGRLEEYEFETAEGEIRTGSHFVVQSLRFLRRKIRREGCPARQRPQHL